MRSITCKQLPRSRTTAVLLPVLLCAALWAGRANAANTAYVEIGTPWPIVSTSGATSASMSQQSSPLYGVTASADSWSGRLTSFQYGKVLTSDSSPYVQSFSAASKALVTDTVHFQNYQPGDVATLYFSVHGSFVDNAPAGFEEYSSAWGNYWVQAYTGSGNNYQKSIGFASDPLTASTMGCFGADCLIGDNPGTTIGSLTIPITGDQYTFISRLKISVTGYTADFASTARVYLSLPTGVTYTSGSGSFLAGATPIAAVPEPETYAMLLAGLGIVGAVTRRRRIERA
jgi:hypothetical protein